MIISTEYLGDYEYKEEDVIQIEKGLYGFENLHRFILIEHPEPKMPYMWLQSLKEKNIYFVVTNPFIFVSDYDFDLPESVVEKLSIETVDQVLSLTLVVIPENIKDTTINLQAPIILNKVLKKGEQVILSEEYPLKYKLFRKGVE